MSISVRHDRRDDLSKATQAVPVDVGGGLALAQYNGFGRGTMVGGWGGLLGPGAGAWAVELMDRVALDMPTVVRTHPLPGPFTAGRGLWGRGRLEPRLVPQRLTDRVGHHSGSLTVPAGLLGVTIADVIAEGGVPVDVGVPFGLRIQEKLLDGLRQVAARGVDVPPSLEVIGDRELGGG
jgi:hypothetical protein